MPASRFAGRRFHAWRNAIPLVLAAGISLAFTCHQDKPNRPSTGTQAQLTAEQVAHFAPQLVGISRKLRWNFGIFPMYSDDQRLREGPKDMYGPIAAIAASDTLKDFHSPSDFEPSSGKGRLVAAINVDTTGIDATQLPESYQDLKLSPGDNCVYLKHTPSTEDWTAYVTPMSSTVGQECPNDHDVTRYLKVMRVVDEEYSDPEHVPPVARFHEGEYKGNKGRPFFGVRCGDGAWCMILPDGMKTNKPFHSKPNQSVQATVHGWGDVQHLGVGDKGKPTKYHKDLVASIVPKPNLHKLRKDHEFKDKWRWVATVQFEKSPRNTPYEEKWYFQQEDNRIELKWVSDTMVWRARVRVGAGTNQEDTIALGPVRETRHSNVPATARFAWKEDDEWLWVRCDEGCCEVESGTGIGKGTKGRPRRPR
jgi:hypothetical protein